MQYEKRYIQSHCGLRGIAAALVVSYHLQFGANYLFHFESATPFFKRGYLWVDLFFILSGFIISFTTVTVDKKFTKNEIARFFRQRFARIYPLHLFCLLYLVSALGIIALLQNAIGSKVNDPHWTSDGAVSLLTEVLLIHAWGFGHNVAWNIPSWSISAEVFAYLLFPALYAAGKHPWARAGMVAGAALFFSWIAITSGDLDIISGAAPFRCLAGFIIGMEIYRARNVFGAMSDSVSSAVQIGAALAIFALLLVPANDVLLIIPFALLVGCTWHDKGAIAKILASRPLQWLGDLSYSIYLNHVCVIQILWFFWGRLTAKFNFPEPESRLAWIVIVYCTTLLISHFTYRYIEKPARRALSRRVISAEPKPH